MTADAPLEVARAAFGRQEWVAARAAYAAAMDSTPVPLDDIERYAVAAHLVGDEDECRSALNRGYRDGLERQDVTRAVRFAFFLGHSMILTGESGQAAGWFARARDLLSERGSDCAEWGYLMVPAGIGQMEAGDFEAGFETFREARTIGRRFADPHLLAVSGHGLGRALIRLGRIAEGMAILDEVMVAVANGEVTPLLVGQVYCGILEACQEVFDIQRAREWTALLSRWCEGQPDLVPYRGPCLIHRVELMRLKGDWEDAIEEAQRACDWLSLPGSFESAGDAFYLLGDLYRLRGEYAESEEAYRQASRLGRLPEPGLALLWLARGQNEAAAAALQRAVAEPTENAQRRAELLSASVEVALAQGDMALARRLADDLTALADGVAALPLKAMADRNMGSVLIAAGEASAALPHLRRAWAAWKQVDAPYEAALVRASIAAACRALGDAESAEMEADAARWVFERLGAEPDIARLESGSGAATPATADRLTARETEVLTLVASGDTNREIAAALVISEHTVARHIQNMLQKLGFTSRASLAAFAVERGIARASRGQN